MRKNFFNSDDEDEEEAPKPDLLRTQQSPSEHQLHLAIHMLNQAPLLPSRAPLPELYLEADEPAVGLFDLVPKEQFGKTAALFCYLYKKAGQNAAKIEVLIKKLLAFNVGADSPAAAMAELLPWIKQLLQEIRAVMAIVQNVVLQLHLMINKKEPSYKGLWSKLQFFFPFQIIGRALSPIIFADLAVNFNESIASSWNAFKAIVNLAKPQPQKYGTSTAVLKRLQKLLIRIDNTVLSGNLVGEVLQQEWEESVEKCKLSAFGTLKGNKELKQFFKGYILTLTNLFSGPSRYELRNADQLLLSLLCNYSLYRRIYQDEDRDLFKKLWTLQKKYSYVSGPCNLLAYTYDLLNRCCPLSKKSNSLDPKSPVALLQQLSSTVISSLEAEATETYRRYLIWKYRANAVMEDCSAADSAAVLRQKTKVKIQMVRQGIDLAGKARRLCLNGLVVGSDCGKEVGPGGWRWIGLLLQSIRGVGEVLGGSWFKLNYSLMLRMGAKQVRKQAQKIKSQVDQVKKEKDRSPDLELALSTILSATSGLFDREKLVVLTYCQAFTSHKGLVKDLDIVSLNQSVAQLALLLDVVNESARELDTKFLLPWFDAQVEIVRQHLNAGRSLSSLELALSAFLCLGQLFEKPRLEQLVDGVQQGILAELQRMAGECEQSLRLLTHQLVNEKCPVESRGEQTLLWLGQEFRLWGRAINPKREVELHLNERFYSMNLINLYNVEVYEQMRVLAGNLFGLNLFDVHLPNQTVEQSGFDVLATVRALPQFLSRYRYILADERFVQNPGDAKMLESVGVSQLIESIKTHGRGVVSTVVNESFKLLKAQFKGLSNFLYDEELKILLNKERVWFRDLFKSNSDAAYSYQRACFLQKQIAKARPTEGRTHVDALRELLTTCGNLLAFVRMLRTTSLYISSAASAKSPSLVQHSQGWGQAVKQACREAEQMVQFVCQENKATDFLEVLLTTFRKGMNESQKHLKLFYLLVPVLTISFVNHARVGKEEAGKRNSHLAFIADDGFFLGVSFFVSLFEQQAHLKALRWFSAVMQHYDLEIKRANQLLRAEREKQAERNSEELDGQMSARKLMHELIEFKNAENTLMATNILFHYEREQPPAPQ